MVRPGGVIGLVWNIRDTRVPWIADLAEMIDSDERPNSIGEIAQTFADVERAEFEHSVALAPEAVIGLVSTISYLRLRPDAAQVFASVRELLATHPDTAGHDVVEVPYVTTTFRIPVPGTGGPDDL